MRENKVKRQWREGQPSVGTWLCLGNPLAAEILAHVGFDWLTVDMEHNAIDVADTQALLQAIATTDTMPFVRVPWNDPQMIKRVLDIGAYGVVIPNVLDRREAEQAVAACRYPPGRHPRRRHPARAALRRPRLHRRRQPRDRRHRHDRAHRRSESGGRYHQHAWCRLGVHRPQRPGGLHRTSSGLDNPHPEHQKAVAIVLAVGKRFGRAGRHPLRRRRSGEPAHRRRIPLAGDVHRRRLPGRSRPRSLPALGHDRGGGGPSSSPSRRRRIDAVEETTELAG